MGSPPGNSQKWSCYMIVMINPPQSFSPPVTNKKMEVKLMSYTYYVVLIGVIGIYAEGVDSRGNNEMTVSSIRAENN